MVGVYQNIKVKGELSREKVELVRRELMECEMVPDSIVIGGPGNSLIRHGPSNRRGFGPETKLVVREEGKGGGGSIRQEFHLTEPSRLNMIERGGVVRMVEEIVKSCRELVPEASIVNLGTTPRHVEKCCGREDHMKEDDSWILENQRREMESEIGRRIEKECEVIPWYEAKGMEKEPELTVIRKMGVVSEDGVHMSEGMCRSTAVNLCFRLAEADVMLVGERDMKRRKIT